MELGFGFTTIVIIIFALYLLSSIKILAEYERGVIFRLGRLLPEAKGPGLIFVFAPLDRWFASPCGRRLWKCRRRTLSRATT
jgi:regulator of protease activity HflC (stomatin/prohibitin superfamily)